MASTTKEHTGIDRRRVAGLQVQLDPLRVVSQRADGSTRWEIVRVGMRSADGGWRPVRGVEVDEAERGAGIVVEDPDGIRATLTLAASERGVDVELRADASAVAWLSIDLAAAPEEHYVGFGERFDSVDQRGRQIDLRVINGAVRDLAYKPVPFFMSTGGYGARMIGDLRGLVRVATADDPHVVSMRGRGSSLHVRLYSGDDFKEILQQYTADVGRPAVPPPWVFGPWKSRDWTEETQDTVLEDVRKGREHGLAGTVKLIDATWEVETHDFLFDPQKYPDPEGMIREVKGLGYEIVLWVAPFMVRGLDPGPSYREAEAKGYLIRHPDGGTYVHRLGNSPTFLGTCIDFTNPDAVAWWKGHIRRLARMGISGFKTDFGEQVPDDAVFADGRRGWEVRNIYPYLYNRATYDAMQEEIDGVLLGRAAWDGSQALSAIWAGDQTADFGPASGLPSVIRAGQTAGMSGFPFWASDIGGYFGTPTDEVFTRWSQFGAFSPIMQIHGMGRREPWAFEADTLETYRRYAQVHLDLFPYLYSYAHQASRTGIPMMRALALEFPGDPGVWGDMPEHQFCLGRELLVAPIYHGYDYHRHTYLPEGEWRDFWTGARMTGGQTHVVPSALDTMPVFVRAGGIVPLLDPSPATLLPVEAPDTTVAGDDLRVQVYPGADGEFELYDGTRFVWKERDRNLTIHNGPRPRQVASTLVGVEALAAVVRNAEGEAIEHATTSRGGGEGYVRVPLGSGAACVVSWDAGSEKGGGRRER